MKLSRSIATVALGAGLALIGGTGAATAASAAPCTSDCTIDDAVNDAANPDFGDNADWSDPSRPYDDPTMSRPDWY